MLFYVRDIWSLIDVILSGWCCSAVLGSTPPIPSSSLLILCCHVVMLSCCHVVMRSSGFFSAFLFFFLLYRLWLVHGYQWSSRLYGVITSRRLVKDGFKPIALLPTYNCNNARIASRLYCEVKMCNKISTNWKNTQSEYVLTFLTFFFNW